MSDHLDSDTDLEHNAQIGHEQESEVHSQEAKKSFVNSFADNASQGGEFDPNAIDNPYAKKEPTQAEKDAAAEHQENLALSEFVAQSAIDSIEVWLQEGVDESITINPIKKAKLAKASAPLMLKYGGEMPPWLLAWKDEIVFLGAAAMVGWDVTKQVKTVNNRKALEAKQQTEADSAAS